MVEHPILGPASCNGWRVKSLNWGPVYSHHRFPLYLDKAERLRLYSSHHISIPHINLQQQFVRQILRAVTESKIGELAFKQQCEDHLRSDVCDLQPQCWSPGIWILFFWPWIKEFILQNPGVNKDILHSSWEDAAGFYGFQRIAELLIMVPTRHFEMLQFGSVCVGRVIDKAIFCKLVTELPRIRVRRLEFSWMHYNGQLADT